MKTEIRCHPLCIWDFAKPLLLVWLLPLVKSVAQQIFSNNAEIELFLEGVAIIGIFLYSFFKWKRFLVVVSERGFCITKGRAFYSEIKIPTESVAIIEARKGFLNLVFGGVTVNIYTASHHKPQKLRLNRGNVKVLLAFLKPE